MNKLFNSKTLFKTEIEGNYESFIVIFLITFHPVQDCFSSHKGYELFSPARWCNCNRWLLGRRVRKEWPNLDGGSSESFVWSGKCYILAFNLENFHLGRRNQGWTTNAKLNKWMQNYEKSMQHYVHQVNNDFYWISPWGDSQISIPYLPGGHLISDIFPLASTSKL